MKLIIPVVVLIGSFCVCSEAAKILAVYTTFSKSHLLVGQNLLKNLAIRGHEVTVVSPFPLSKPLKNYREITVPITVDHNSLIDSMVENSGSVLHLIKTQGKLTDMTMQLMNDSINTPQFKKLMAEETFDAVIIGLFFNDFQVGIAAHFKCPLIVISPVGGMKAANDLVGNPTSVAATPHILVNYKKPMTFLQRVTNFGVIIMEYAMMTKMAWTSKKFYDYNFPADKYPTYEEAKRNTALVLSNHFFSEGGVRPNVPNMVEVGGLQIKDKPDPLPENIEKWLSEAKHGVIFFSLGSNVQSSSLPAEKLRVFLDTFAKIKQRVLWKWETADLPIKLDNVMTAKWLPQDDILAHKNVKLFITHGGMGSIVESKFHGVPILGIPFFGDQMSNVEAAVEEGWARRVDFADLTIDKFSAAMRDLLEKPNYGETVRNISALYRDRPFSALETATYWTEYVIRHKGAPHMRYPGVDLNFFQYNSLDVVGFLLLVVYLTWSLLKSVFRLVFPGKKQLEKSPKKVKRN